MVRLLYLFSILLLSTTYAEDQYAVKGEGWKAWQHMERTILSGKEKKSLELLSGRMKEGFIRFGMDSIMAEVKAMQPVFIREFTNKNKNVLYLIINVQGDERTLMFIKQDKIWTFDDQNNENYKDPEEALNSLTVMQVQNKLKSIGEAVYTHFFTNNKKKILGSPDDMKVDKKNLKYFDPEDKKELDILMVKDLPYEGSANLLLAVTEKPINDSHYAVFEDGSVKSITIQQFKLHLNLDGIKANVKYDQQFDQQYSQKLKDLINGLGAASFKDRKKAKSGLIEEGRKILPFLRKNSQHDDFEVRVSIKEIIKEIENKTGNRPRIP